MTIFYSIIIFYLGALFGSFGNVLAKRIPIKESLHSKSYCESCKHSLRFVDVLPIFGYIINMGKCHFCHHKISLTHVIIELISGGLFLFAYMMNPTWSIEFFISLILIFVLITLSLSDIYYKIVIDRIWLNGFVLIFILRIIQGSLGSYLLSALGLFAIMIGIALLGQSLFKRDALGGGDIKIYLFIGMSLSFYYGLLSIFIAALLGLLYALVRSIKQKHEMPFIPMISLAVIICYFYGEAMISWYLSLLGV